MRIDDLTVQHVKEIFALHEDCLDGGRDFRNEFPCIESPEEVLRILKEDRAYRLGSRFNSHSKISLDGHDEIAVRFFPNMASDYPRYAEVQQKGLEFDRQVRQYLKSQ